MITILTDKEAHGLGQDLYDQLVKTRRDVKQFFLEGMDIKPCYACRSCEEKSYGRCAVRDDADLILPFLARSETIIVLTPVVFGGYSVQTKRVVDKLPLISDKHYHYDNGELAKGSKFSGIQYYAIGICGGDDPEEGQAFERLIMETLAIATWAGKPLILPRDADDLNQLIGEVAGQ